MKVELQPGPVLDHFTMRLKPESQVEETWLICLRSLVMSQHDLTAAHPVRRPYVELELTFRPKDSDCRVASVRQQVWNLLTPCDSRDRSLQAVAELLACEIDQLKNPA